jgi:drug/metabolite transporter (DMT)-like permease
MMLFFAGLLGIVLNQGCFTFGLSLTSPIDASIVTTTAPIATMIVAAIYLKEPVTGKKVIGIFLGSIGALTLILSSQGSTDGKGGSIPGDLLCLLAQISFSFYLAIFKGLISRYNIFTLMKWMFTYAAICFIPFSYHEVSTIHFHEISTSTWACVAYVIVGGTFLAYILMMIGQKTLRPTVISMYNYVQPIVGTSVSILLGMGTFGVAKGIAVALVFTGVYIVTQSKSREQMLAEQAAKKE